MTHDFMAPLWVKFRAKPERWIIDGSNYRRWVDPLYVTKDKSRLVTLRFPTAPSGEDPFLVDPWQLRDHFLGLDLRDRCAVLEFLRTTGDWPTHRGVLEARALVGFQTRLRDRLTKPRATKNGFWTWDPTPVGVMLEYSERPPGLSVSIHCQTALEAMDWSVDFDLARGARFRYCARADCPEFRAGKKPFELTTRHVRKYCSWRCAHLEAVRRGRNRD